MLAPFFWGGWWVLQYLVVSTGIHMESSLQKFSGSSAVSLANQRPWIRGFWEEKNRRQTWRWKGARNLIELWWTLGFVWMIPIGTETRKRGFETTGDFFLVMRDEEVSSYTHYQHFLLEMVIKNEFNPHVNFGKRKQPTKISFGMMGSWFLCLCLFTGVLDELPQKVWTKKRNW